MLDAVRSQRFKQFIRLSIMQMDHILTRARRMATRKRAAKACLRCKDRKAKCNDYRPCSRCLDSGPTGRELCLNGSLSVRRSSPPPLGMVALGSSNSASDDMRLDGVSSSDLCGIDQRDQCPVTSSSPSSDACPDMTSSSSIDPVDWQGLVRDRIIGDVEPGTEGQIQDPCIWSIPSMPQVKINSCSFSYM